MWQLIRDEGLVSDLNRDQGNYAVEICYRECRNETVDSEEPFYWHPQPVPLVRVRETNPCRYVELLNGSLCCYNYHIAKTVSGVTLLKSVPQAPVDVHKYVAFARTCAVALSCLPSEITEFMCNKYYDLDVSESQLFEDWSMFAGQAKSMIPLLLTQAAIQSQTVSATQVRELSENLASLFH